jgi:rRNA pseudouridine-1189 N-methylase Emg1 (Nep1/Mra1 family)
LLLSGDTDPRDTPLDPRKTLWLPLGTVSEVPGATKLPRMTYTFLGLMKVLCKLVYIPDINLRDTPGDTVQEALQSTQRPTVVLNQQLEVLRAVELPRPANAFLNSMGL